MLLLAMTMKKLLPPKCSSIVRLEFRNQQAERFAAASAASSSAWS